MSKTIPSSPQGARTYQYETAEAMAARPRPVLVPDRRWPLWIARFALAAATCGTAPLLWRFLGNAQGRETLVMSALGMALVGTVFLLWAHETINKAGKVPGRRFSKAALTFGASCVAVGAFLLGAQAAVAHAHRKVTREGRALRSARGRSGLGVHPSDMHRLPRFSTRMTGVAQAPVSLVFLGSGAELLEAFTAAGWHAAERITPRTAFRAVVRGALDRPYPCAPVLPCFLDGRLHDVAFQTTDPGGSSRRRHHARWWLTGFTCAGRQVWVATASYDAGVGVGRMLPVPIHHIDPDIDKERDYIGRSLEASGLVRVTQELRITEPMMGRNAAGDRFFTRGLALVLSRVQLSPSLPAARRSCVGSKHPHPPGAEKTYGQWDPDCEKPVAD